MMTFFFFKAAVVVKTTKILVFFFLCYSILANKSLFSQNMKSLILKDDVVPHVSPLDFPKLNYPVEMGFLKISHRVGTQ